jgi:5,10-methenyltetrahydromethanopterin hydrogenase
MKIQSKLIGNSAYFIFLHASLTKFHGTIPSGSITSQPCLVPMTKLYTISHQMFRHQHEVLNID